jgi:fructose-1,6-bisphosphatase/sedoheptulose 1,7-bisphosphatase-like protein
VITEAAALGAAEWIGRGDGLAGELAARRAMAGAIAEMPVKVKVVASRGSGRVPPVLQPGDELGGTAAGAEPGGEGAATAESASWDAVVQPLEALNALARGAEGALAMIAAGPEGTLMPVPEMYMQKVIVAGRAAAAVDIDAPVGENFRRVAAALGCEPGELVVVVLDRPRHDELAAQIRAAGARLLLIPDGDISAGIAAASRDSAVHMTMGIGGSVEGVIAAAAIRCLGGDIHARFWPVSRHQVEQVRAAGLADVEAPLVTSDLAGEGVLFAATAVTGGRFLRGIDVRPDGVQTETLVLCSNCHAVRTIKTLHRSENGGPMVALGMR